MLENKNKIQHKVTGAIIISFTGSNFISIFSPWSVLGDVQCLRIANYSRYLRVRLITRIALTANSQLRCSPLNNIILKCTLVVVALVLNDCVTCTKANQDCNTPKALFTSFLIDSWRSAKNRKVLPSNPAEMGLFWRNCSSWIYLIWKIISYVILMMTYSYLGAQSSYYSWKTRECLRTFISFRFLGQPKNTCHTQKSYDERFQRW